MSTFPIHQYQQHDNLEKLKFFLQQKLDIPIDKKVDSSVEYRPITHVPPADSASFQLTDQISHYLQDQNNELNFHIDASSGDLVISVVNKETKEVIRNIPIDKIVLDKSESRELKSLFYNIRA